jgi:hypothetical protein
MIDSAWVLHLDKRWKENSGIVVQLQNDINKYLGLELNIFFAGDGSVSEIDYDHIDSKDPNLWNFLVRPAQHSFIFHANAFLCHKKIFNRILKDLTINDYNKKFLICEDDAYLINNRWNSLSEEGWDFINNGDYDVLFLGWQGKENPGDSDDMERAETYYQWTGQGNIERCTKDGPKISGLHGIVMNGYAIDHLSRINKGPVDSYINEYMLDMEVYYIRPKIIGSKAGFSYCENKWQDRSELK